jgi:hypothetical protein
MRSANVRADAIMFNSVLSAHARNRCSRHWTTIELMDAPIVERQKHPAELARGCASI